MLNRIILCECEGMRWDANVVGFEVFRCSADEASLTLKWVWSGGEDVGVMMWSLSLSYRQLFPHWEREGGGGGGGLLHPLVVRWPSVCVEEEDPVPPVAPLVQLASLEDGKRVIWSCFLYLSKCLILCDSFLQSLPKLSLEKFLWFCLIILSWCFPYSKHKKLFVNFTQRAWNQLFVWA